MNNELMRDENFIRCSTMIAELLMKYKFMETEEDQEGWMQEASSPQTVEKRHVFKRGYGVLAYSKEIKQEKIALTIRFIFWTAAVRKDCSYMLRIPSMRA